jgi:hypothetical protein
VLDGRAVENCDSANIEHAGANVPGRDPIAIADLPSRAGITQPTRVG